MKKLLLLTLITGTFMLSMPSFVYAVVDQGGSGTSVDIAPQPCDAQYWRQMSARAWMESEREIMQNQNLIFKPDSVLEYVCFDQFVSINGWAGGDIFVHTDYFGPKIIKRTAEEAVQRALFKVVSESLDAYKEKNFNHSFLGGRAVLMNADKANSSFQPAVNKQKYTCQTMSKIWKAAKCANFVDNSSFEATDGFYPFDAIKKHKNGEDVGGYADTIKETRIFPSALRCASDNQGAGGTWEDQIKYAENKGEELYKFQSALGDIFKEVGEKIEPGKCTGSDGNAAKAIKTGIMVIIDGEESHEDGVCTNPGCSYNKDGTCS